MICQYCHKDVGLDLSHVCVEQQVAVQITTLKAEVERLADYCDKLEDTVDKIQGWYDEKRNQLTKAVSGLEGIEKAYVSMTDSDKCEDVMLNLARQTLKDIKGGSDGK